MPPSFAGKIALAGIAAALLCACRDAVTSTSATATAIWAHELRISGDGVLLAQAGDGNHAWATFGTEDSTRLALIDSTGRVVAAHRTPVGEFNYNWAFSDDEAVRLWHTASAADSKTTLFLDEVRLSSANRQIQRHAIGPFDPADLLETPSHRHVWFTQHSTIGTTAITSVYRMDMDGKAPHRIAEIRERPPEGDVAGPFGHLHTTDGDDLVWLDARSVIYTVRASTSSSTETLRIPKSTQIDVWPIDDRFAWISALGSGSSENYTLYLADAAGTSQPVMADTAIEKVVPHDDNGAQVWVKTANELLLVAKGPDAKPRIARRLPFSDVKNWLTSGDIIWAVTGSEVLHADAVGTVTRAHLPVTGDVGEIVPTGDDTVVWFLVSPDADVGPGTAFAATAAGNSLRLRAVRNNIVNVVTVAQSTHAIVGVPKPDEVSGEFDPDYYAYDANGAPLAGDQPLIAGAPVLQEIDVSEDTSWLEPQYGEGTRYVVGAGPYIESATVQFSNGAVLRFPAEKQAFEMPVLTGGRVIDDARFTLHLENQSTPEDLDARLKLTAYDEEGRKTSYSSLIPVADFGNEPVPLNWLVAYNKPSTIVLSYQDRFTPRCEVKWRGVVFRKPLIQEPWFRTTIAFLITVALGAALLFLRVAPVALRAWLPMLMLAAANLGAFSEGALRRDIDGAVLIGLTLATLLLGIVCGFAAPAVFRALARAQPFHLLLSVLLGVPSFRRRFFSNYAKTLANMVAQARRQAHDEQYVALPARVTTQDAKEMIEPKPATAITDLVTSQRPACHVLIEAEGGRGKSALLREILRLSVERFLNESGVVPILCDGTTDSIRTMVRTSLGKYAISEAIVDAEIDAGHFVVMIDGISESSVTASTIESFIRSEAGERTPLVMTSRRRDELRAVLKSAERWCLAEPEKLDDTTYDAFEAAYVQAPGADGDPKVRAVQPLPESVKAICRGRDGGYSPILVRLAILVGADEVTNVSELYAVTFRELFTRRVGAMPADVLDEAARLCVDTYWSTGHRALAYQHAPEARKKLLRALLDAGVVVDVDAPRYPGAEPNEVRFFHDSMQTFLTAKGLLSDDRTWPSKLIEAAGDVRFREALRDDAGGPEIFEMCINVFTKDRLIAELITDLESWAAEHGDLFSLRIVRRAAPHAMRTLHSRNPADALREVIIACRSSAEQLIDLSHVYVRLAPIVWDELTRTAKRTAA